MMSAPKFCTKCDKHHLFSDKCNDKWPFHTEQKCDRCFELGHEAGEKACKTKSPLYLSCARCGHEGFHHTNACPIKDPKEENLNQWTKSKYETYMAKNPGRATNTRQEKGIEKRSTASQNPSSSYSIPIPNRLKSNATQSSAGSSSKNPIPDITTVDLSKMPITSHPIKLIQRRPVILTEDEKERLKWARASFSRVAWGQEPNRDVLIEANFFKVTFRSENILYKYRIELGKINGHEVKKLETRKALIWNLLHVQRKPVHSNWVSDYNTYVISAKPLYSDFNSLSPVIYSVPHYLTPRPGQTSALLDTVFSEERDFKQSVLTKYFGYQSILTPTSADKVNVPNEYHPDEDLKALNVISWKTINDPGKFNGGISGNKFYPGDFSRATELRTEESDTHPTYVLSRGFFTSMRPGANSLLLNVNPTTTAFFPPITVQQWLQSRRLDATIELRKASRELNQVRVTYLGDTPRKLRVIFSIIRDNSLSFTDSNTGKITTVLNHMTKKHDFLRKIDEPTWVNVGNASNPKYYPAVCLSIAPWQVVGGKIDSSFTQDMLEHAQKTPKANKNDFYRAMGQLGVWRDPARPNDPGYNFYGDYGMRVDGEFVKLSARYLNQPSLEFAAKGQGPMPDTCVLRDQEYGKKATWNLMGHQFFQLPGAFDLNYIAIGNARSWKFDFRTSKDLNGVSSPVTFDIKKFCKELQAYLKTNKFPVKSTDIEYVADTGHATLDTAYNKLYSRKQNDQRVVMVFLPTKDASDYNNVKWYGDCYEGILTICVTMDALKKNWTKRNVPQKGFLGNLSMKINFKLEGVCHLLSDSRDWSGANPNTMIVGADVSHPGKGYNKTCPSMAGVVATFQPNCVHYLASARLQKHNSEFISGLGDMIFERLEVYFKAQGSLPEHILFYRDGVSESQYGMVTDKELPLIESACSRSGEIHGKGSGWLPLITILVVGKRHHARFYPLEPADRGVRANLDSGLLVDTVVVAPNRSDFYLQSHDCSLGTARSAHYVVLWNKSNYPLEKLHELTNKLCFTGSRATKGLSACVPARYADILCDRLRCYMATALSTPIPNSEDLTLSDYCKDKYSWGARSDKGATNPWNEGVDHVMFYL